MCSIVVETLTDDQSFVVQRSCAGSKLTLRGIDLTSMEYGQSVQQNSQAFPFFLELTIHGASDHQALLPATKNSGYWTSPTDSGFAYDDPETDGQFARRTRGNSYFIPIQMSTYDGTNLPGYREFNLPLGRDAAIRKGDIITTRLHYRIPDGYGVMSEIRPYTGHVRFVTYLTLE